MALKKSELYSSLWSGCDALRGGMDASQYKDYVLVLLFVKYVSDKYAGQAYAPITIPKGASFADMVALRGNPNIGDLINKKILAPLTVANNLSDMPDFNDEVKLGTGKEKVDRLSDLIAIFENPALDFSKNRADGDDILGDAYEYLMRHFATESGKSKGQFYTPAEVSRVMAHILGIRHAKTSNNTTVYDPTCGSGSLLLKVGEEAAHGKNVKVTLYGQEKDGATSGLARMNMILHDNPTAMIEQGNTLSSPKFTDASGQLKTFDYVVANPPFSDKRWSTGLVADLSKDPFERFKGIGVPPAKQGDYAYLLHILRSLKSTGKGACILPHGVLFRGNAEATIRKSLLSRGYIKAIIGLPANLFYGTGIPACIIVMDKENAAARKGVFMVDASKGYIKDGNKNRLREQDIHRIVDTVARIAEVPRYARMVPLSEIADPKNDFNLNLPRYIDSAEPEDLQDLSAHLHGGIPERDIDALDRYWQVIPSVRKALFKRADRAGYSQLKVAPAEIKPAIFGHNEFTAFNETAGQLFTRWKENNTPLLQGIKATTKPKMLIEALAESLLQTFEKAPLLDAYDIYQHLMDYWSETMQDDAYMVVSDGWKGAATPRRVIEKDKKGKEKDKGWICELAPKALVVARYFAKEQAQITALEAQVEGLAAQMAEMEEEHGGEEGLLFEAQSEKGNLTKVSVKARLAEAEEGGADVASPGEIPLLREFLSLVDKQADCKKQLKEAEAALDDAALAQYAKLSVEEIKTLVVEDKWLAVLSTAIQGELDRVSQTLSGRVKVLSERYAMPLPEIEAQVEELGKKVEGWLGKMGVGK